MRACSAPTSRQRLPPVQETLDARGAADRDSGDRQPHDILVERPVAAGRVFGEQRIGRLHVGNRACCKRTYGKERENGLRVGDLSRTGQRFLDHSRCPRGLTSIRENECSVAEHPMLDLTSATRPVPFEQFIRLAKHVVPEPIVEQVPQQKPARVDHVVHVAPTSCELEPGFDERASASEIVEALLLTEIAVRDGGVLGGEPELETELESRPQVIDPVAIAEVYPCDPAHGKGPNDIRDPISPARSIPFPAHSIACSGLPPRASTAAIRP